MSQPLVDSFPPQLPEYYEHDQITLDHGDCTREGLPTYYTLQLGDLSLHRTPQFIGGSDFSFSSPIASSSLCSDTSAESTSSPLSDPTGVRTPFSDKSFTGYYQEAVLIPPVGGSNSNGTPSTILESHGHTPLPMKTPQTISLSDHLAYIDEKLLEHVSEPQYHDEAPRFPPGLSPWNQGIMKSSSQGTTATELEQQFINYPSSQTFTGVRRTHSRVVREELECTPPETNVEQPRDVPGAKRRRLCQHDSTASAHTFIAKEPASLRKAKSLAAGDTGRISWPHPRFALERLGVPPITVPTIPSRDVALSRLRVLIKREIDQRSEDHRLMLAAERPDGLIFDDDLRLLTVEWLLAVKGPEGHDCKPLRRHLRVSTETRYHAVWLFSRYAIRMPDSRFNPFLKPLHGWEDRYRRRIRENLVREAAVACLAIAAKFHHDFLPPLKPITADQFLYLFPDDHPVAFDEFEMVQRSILQSFGYVIYQPTPQAYLQELWKACDTLQPIQDQHPRYLRTMVQAHTFELIEFCLHEQDSMGYSAAYLASSALLEALHLEELHHQCVAHSNDHHRELRYQENSSSNIRVCVRCVNDEICEAMGLLSNALLSCRDWMMTVWVGDMVV